MKSSLRALLFLSAVAVVTAFFLPWISVEISGIRLLKISGFNILTELNSVSGMFQNQIWSFRLKLLMIPLVSVFIIIAIIKKWKSYLFIIPAILIFGYYIYFIISMYDLISNGLENLYQGKEILDKLKGIKGMKLDIDYKIIGKGLYITVIGFTLIIILGLKDLFTLKRRW